MGGGGADDLSGGNGFDLADYSDHTASVSLTLDGEADDGEPERATASAAMWRTCAAATAPTRSWATLPTTSSTAALERTRSAAAPVDGVDYSLRANPVNVDLATPRVDGEAGEEDTVGADLEGAFGGSGNDVLTATPPTASSSAARATTDPRPRRRGLLDGGDGNDEIETYDGARDENDCGEGTDRVWRDAGDTVDRDCEWSSNAAPKAVRSRSATPRPRPGSRVWCAFRCRARPCSGARRHRPARDPQGGDPRAPGDRPPRVGEFVRCTEPCGATAQLKGKRGVVARGALKQLALGPRTLRLKLTNAGRRALRTGQYELTVRSPTVGNARRVVRTLQVN